MLLSSAYSCPTKRSAVIAFAPVTQLSHWIESRALSLAGEPPLAASVSSLYGKVPECFSAGPLAGVAGGHRDGAAAGEGGYPFAWSQLVLYHRGPDHPLGTPPGWLGNPEGPNLHHWPVLGDR